MGNVCDELEHDVALVETIHPTMHGFVWRHPGGRHPVGLPGDSWCVRDSICQLFHWSPGSWEWQQFRELPHPEDLSYLEQHLGLIHVSSSEPAEMEWFARNNAHPGVVIWRLNTPGGVVGHATYAEDLRRVSKLPAAYDAFQPVADGYLVDVRQEVD